VDKIASLKTKHPKRIMMFPWKPGILNQQIPNYVSGGFLVLVIAFMDTTK
jgi:hypothetical protein